MKLIFCPSCEDVVKLLMRRGRTCRCGRSAGYYRNEVDAVVTGLGIPIGIMSGSLRDALQAREREEGETARRVEAFVFPKAHPHITHLILDRALSKP